MACEVLAWNVCGDCCVDALPLRCLLRDVTSWYSRDLCDAAGLIACHWLFMVLLQGMLYVGDIS